MMTANDNPVNQELKRQAAEWFCLMNASAPPSEDLMVACGKWLQLSPEHEKAYCRYEETWGVLGAFGQDEKLRAELKAELTQWVHTETRHRKILPLVWGVVAVLIATIFFLIKPADNLFQTATGEQTVVELMDGSEVTLNTATEIHSDFSGGERRIYMERGEAFFDVSKDPSRPFVVYAGAGSVRAIGTAFNVRVKKETVEVTLVEGRVAVAANASATDKLGNQLELDPGKQASFSLRGEIGVVTDVDTSQIVEWQHRRLSFSHMPLQDVVDEINRYTPIKLVICNASIGREEVSAFFLIDNLNGFLDALNNIFDIETVHKSGKIVLCRSDA